MHILAAEFKRMFAMRPRQIVYNRVGILFLILVVAGTHSHLPQIYDRYILRTRRAWILIGQTVVRILQSQVIHPIAVDAPHIVYRELTVAIKLALVEPLLGGIHRENECRLTEVESRAQLMVSNAIVAVYLGIVFVCTDRTDNDQIPNGNVLAIYRGRRWLPRPRIE